MTTIQKDRSWAGRAVTTAMGVVAFGVGFRALMWMRVHPEAMLAFLDASPPPLLLMPPIGATRIILA